MHPKMLTSFQQEMQKMAKESVRDTVAADIKMKRRDAARDRHATQKSHLAIAGGSLGAYAATMVLLKNPFQPGTREEMVKHVHQMAEKMGLDKLYVRTPSGIDPGSWNPYFSFDNAVNIPLHLRDSVIAHELGHAKNFKLIGEVGKEFSKNYYKAQTVSRVGSGYTMAPALAVAAAIPVTSKAVYVPGVLQAILSAPMVVEEAAASARATAHLIREHGAVEGVVKSLPLIPAFATYAALAGAPLLLAYLRRSAAEKAALQKPEARVEKVKTSKKGDDGLSFFERHPKKLLGGAAMTALGAGLLLKGKKAPAMILPKSAPAVVAKTAPARLSLDEALTQSKYPGARPVKPKPPAKKVAIHKFEKKPDYEPTHFSEGITSGHRDRSVDVPRNPKGSHKELKRQATTMSQPKAKFDESDAEKLLKAMGDFTKHSSIASRFSMAYSYR